MNIFVACLVAMISFFVSCETLCMNKEKTKQEYYSACKKINAIHEIKSNEYEKKSSDKDFNQEIVVIEGKLNRYNNYLSAIKSQALDEFQETHKIDKPLWQRCMRVLNEVDALSKKTTHIVIPSVRHDRDFPLDLKNMFDNELKIQGINIEQIHVQCSNKGFFFCNRLNPFPPVEVKSNGDLVLNTHMINPGILQENLNCFENKSVEEKKARVIFNVASMAQELASLVHVVMVFRRRFFVRSYAVIEREDLGFLSALYLERLPSLCAALRSQETATLMKLHMSSNFYPAFTAQDYSFLCKIVRCWDKLDYVKQSCLKNQLGNILSFQSDEDVIIEDSDE